MPSTTPEPIVISATPAAPNPAPAPAAKKGVPKSVFIILGGLVVGAILIISLLAFTTPTTRDAELVSDQVVTNIQGNNSSSVYALTSEEFKKTTTEAALRTTLNTISPELDGQKKVTDRAIKKVKGITNAIIVYTIRTDDGDRYVRVVLVRKNNSWQVASFRSSEMPLDTSI